MIFRFFGWLIVIAIVLTVAAFFFGLWLYNKDRSEKREAALREREIAAEKAYMDAIFEKSQRNRESPPKPPVEEKPAKPAKPVNPFEVPR